MAFFIRSLITTYRSILSNAFMLFTLNKSRILLFITNQNDLNIPLTHNSAVTIPVGFKESIIISTNMEIKGMYIIFVCCNSVSNSLKILFSFLESHIFKKHDKILYAEKNNYKY